MGEILSRSASPEKLFCEGREVAKSDSLKELKWPDRRLLRIAEDRWSWLHMDYCVDYSRLTVYIAFGKSRRYKYSRLRLRLLSSHLVQKFIIHGSARPEIVVDFGARYGNTYRIGIIKLKKVRGT